MFACGGPIRERQKFTDLTTDELRALAAKTDNGTASWSQWDRDMLLAFFHNRYRDGVIPEEMR